MHFQVPDSDLMRGRCPCSAHRSNSIAAQPKSVSDSPAKIEPVAREARAEAATKISAGRGVSQKRYGEPQNNSFVAIHRPTKEPIRSIFHQGLLNREQGCKPTHRTIAAALGAPPPRTVENCWRLAMVAEQDRNNEPCRRDASSLVDCILLSAPECHAVFAIMISVADQPGFIATRRSLRRKNKYKVSGTTTVMKSRNT